MLTLNKVFFTAPGGDGENSAPRNIIDGLDFTFEDGKFTPLRAPTAAERQRWPN
jgi:hypothetical protein